MKALTLYQPWATLVAIGAKKIETRSWATKYRGPLAIHAGKDRRFIDEKSPYDVCSDEPFYGWLIWHTRQLIAEYKSPQEIAKHLVPLGAVVAVGELVQCIQIPEIPQEFNKFDLKEFERLMVISPGEKTTIAIPPDGKEFHFGNYAPGRWAWILHNVEVLPEPVPVRGYQGLWEWDEGLT